MRTTDGLRQWRSLPGEILIQILEYLPIRDVWAITETCKAFREDSRIKNTAYKEPFSQLDHPFTIPDLSALPYRGSSPPLRAGAPDNTLAPRSVFASDLHDGYYDDFAVIAGKGAIDDANFMNKALFQHITSALSLQPSLGDMVRHLAICNWTEPLDFQRVANNCCKVQTPDLSIYMREIDDIQRPQDNITPITVKLHRRRTPEPILPWHFILTKCDTIFSNVTGIILNYSGHKRDWHRDTGSFWNVHPPSTLMHRQHAENRLPALLDRAPQLQHLELRGVVTPEPKFKNWDWRHPFAAEQLQSQLLRHVSRKIKVLHFENMISTIRNYQTFFAPFSELPDLKKIIISFDSDLQYLEMYRFKDRYLKTLRPDPRLHVVTANTTRDAWSYMSSLKALADTETWEIASSKPVRPIPMDPYMVETLDWPKDTELISLFRWAKEAFGWKPICAWHKFMSKAEGSVLEHRLSQEIWQCATFFGYLQDAGLEVALHLESRNENGTLFVEDWFPIPDWDDVPSESEGDAELSEEEYSGFEELYAPENWGMSQIAESVTSLEIRWGKTFLRTPLPTSAKYGNAAHDLIVYYKARSKHWKMQQEIAGTQRLFKQIKENFINLKRLHLFIPNSLYQDDTLFIRDVLPGEGWTVSRRPDTLIQDLRRIDMRDPDSDVMFLERIFVRNVHER